MPDDFGGAFRRLSAEAVQAVIVPANGLLNSHLKQIVELSVSLRLPLFFSQRYGVEAGGLASYGINTAAILGGPPRTSTRFLKALSPATYPLSSDQARACRRSQGCQSARAHLAGVTAGPRRRHN